MKNPNRLAATMAASQTFLKLAEICDHDKGEHVLMTDGIDELHLTIFTATEQRRSKIYDAIRPYRIFAETGLSYLTRSDCYTIDLYYKF